MLEKTDYKSIRRIHDNDWSVSTGAKTPDNQKENRKPNKAETFIRAFKEETGKLPPLKTVAQATGLSPRGVDNAMRTVKAAETATEITYTKAQDHHVAARIKALDKLREAEFNERVRLGVLEDNRAYLEGLEELEKKAREKEETYTDLINNYKPVFTKTEYVDILFCARNDHVAQDRHHRATLALEAKKFQLTGEK